MRAFGAIANPVSFGPAPGLARLEALAARSVDTAEAPVALEEPLCRRSLSRLRTLLLRLMEPVSPSNKLPFGVVCKSLDILLLNVLLCFRLLTGSASSATGVFVLSSDGFSYAADTALFASMSSILAAASSR